MRRWPELPKLIVFTIPESSNMLTSVPPRIWPVQRETKPGQPRGTKNAQNRVPWLGLTSYLLLKLGLSNLEFWSPLFYISFFHSSKRYLRRANIQQVQGKLGIQRWLRHSRFLSETSCSLETGLGTACAGSKGWMLWLPRVHRKGVPPSAGEAFALEFTR